MFFFEWVGKIALNHKRIEEKLWWCLGKYKIIINLIIIELINKRALKKMKMMKKYSISNIAALKSILFEEQNKCKIILPSPTHPTLRKILL